MTKPKPVSDLHVAYLVGRYPTPSNTFVYREISAVASVAKVDAYALTRTDEANSNMVPAKSLRWVPSASTVLMADSINNGVGERWIASGGRKKDLRRAGWLARRWRKSGVDVVHVHFLGFSAALAAVACAVANIPLVVTVHARGVLVPDPMAPFVLDHAARIVAISQHTQNVLKATFGHESDVIPLPVEQYDQAPEAEGPLHVLTVARSVPKKGYDVLRSAMEHVSVPRKWSVFGATEAEVGGSVDGLEAHGLADFESIKECYANGVDVFALACRSASDGDEDGVPVALLEAMAHGVCVVTTPVGGIPELIVDGHNGLLVPPNDVPALRDALEALAEDPQRRRSLAKRGRMDVRKHRRTDVHLARLVALFETLGSSARP